MLLHTKLCHLTMTGENQQLTSLHDQPQAARLDPQGKRAVSMLTSHYKPGLQAYHLHLDAGHTQQTMQAAWTQTAVLMHFKQKLHGRPPMRAWIVPCSWLETPYCSGMRFLYMSLSLMTTGYLSSGSRYVYLLMFDLKSQHWLH